MLRFGDCELNVEARELVRNGVAVPVEPQVFDVLTYLIDHRNRVVSKIDLLDAVWGDRFVSESALTTRVKQARRAVGDSGRDQRIIRTIHGRGFRFVAEIEDAEQEGGERSRADGGCDSDDTDLTARVIAALEAEQGGAFEVIGSRNAALGLLVDAVYEQCARRGFLVARGSGAGAGLRQYGCMMDVIDELVQRDPALLDRVPPTCRVELDAVAAGKPTAKSRVFLSVRELLAAAADRSPTLIVVDELQLADPETIALLDHAARIARHHHLVVLAAHTPDVSLQGAYERVLLDAGVDDDGSEHEAVPGDLLEVLRSVALEGATFDVPGFRAAARNDAFRADRALDLALDLGLVTPLPGGTGFRFTPPGLADELVADLAPHRRAALHRRMAERLEGSGADPARIAHHLLAADDPDAAFPFVVEAARQAADERRFSDVVRWTGEVVELAAGEPRRELLTLRAAALADSGDPTAVHVYREALALTPRAESASVRAGLARAAMLSGDLATAEEALAGVPPELGDQNGSVLLARAMLAYFQGDLDAADEVLVRAREAAFDPATPARLLDVITLQGLIAHNRGEWFDRLRRELRTTKDSPGLAVTVFDGHLCVAEYLLYGPTPYAEVVALARDLEDTAREHGARRAVAFALCVAGEAELLAGEFDLARRDLEESEALHRELGADTGTAHSLQRLAELELALGDPVAATRLLRQALVLARWSPMSYHLVQRIYGTLIAAAPDPDTALILVDEAAEVLDGPTACEACQVMVEVPAAIACAEAGRLDEARRHLATAEWSAKFWEGTAWAGAIAEAQAVIAIAEGRPADADALFTRAASLFEQAGQPVDAARCRDAVAA